MYAADVAAATDSATVHAMGSSGFEQLSRLEEIAGQVAGHRSIRPENLGTEAPLLAVAEAP